MKILNRLLNSIRCHTKPSPNRPITDSKKTHAIISLNNTELLLLSLRRRFFEQESKSREEKGYLLEIEYAQNCSDRIPAPFFVFLDHRLVEDPSSITNTIAIKAFILINEKKQPKSLACWVCFYLIVVFLDQNSRRYLTTLNTEPLIRRRFRINAS